MYEQQQQNYSPFKVKVVEKCPADEKELKKTAAPSDLGQFLTGIYILAIRPPNLRTCSIKH